MGIVETMINIYFTSLAGLVVFIIIGTAIYFHYKDRLFWNLWLKIINSFFDFKLDETFLSRVNINFKNGGIWEQISAFYVCPKNHTSALLKNYSQNRFLIECNFYEFWENFLDFKICLSLD
jgi:hypothetical protein